MEAQVKTPRNAAHRFNSSRNRTMRSRSLVGISLVLLTALGCGEKADNAESCNFHGGAEAIESNCAAADILLCVTTTLDATGNPVESLHDWNCDGSIDDCRYKTFNDQGRLLTYAIDADCDGNPVVVLEFTYDENGYLVSQWVGWGLNLCHINYVYDAQGNLLSYETDSDCDGTIDSCATYTRDEQGNRVSIEIDDGCDGTPDRCVTYTTDEQGNRTFFRQDDCAGSPLIYEVFTYDENGNRLAEETDRDCDGIPEDCMTFTYYLEGYEATVGIDSDCDGVASSCIVYEYLCRPADR